MKKPGPADVDAARRLLAYEGGDGGSAEECAAAAGRVVGRRRSWTCEQRRAIGSFVQRLPCWWQCVGVKYVTMSWVAKREGGSRQGKAATDTELTARGWLGTVASS